MSAMRTTKSKGTGAAPPKGRIAMLEAGVRELMVQPNTIVLKDVINPNRQDNGYDVILVENPGDTPPERLVASGGQIKDQDSIICETDASARVAATNASNQEVDIVSVAGDNPADVIINWEEVTSVDEYYNGQGTTYDISVDDGANGVHFTIVG